MNYPDSMLLFMLTFKLARNNYKNVLITSASLKSY